MQKSNTDSVVLGYIGEETYPEDNDDPYVTKLFGQPSWLHKDKLPHVLCDVCQNDKYMTLVVQSYAPLSLPSFQVPEILAPPSSPYKILGPLTRHYDRILYLFCCLNSNCALQPGSWKALRMQIPSQVDDNQQNENEKQELNGEDDDHYYEDLDDEEDEEEEEEGEEEEGKGKASRKGDELASWWEEGREKGRGRNKINQQKTKNKKKKESKVYSSNLFGEGSSLSWDEPDPKGNDEYEEEDHEEEEEEEDDEDDEDDEGEGEGEEEEGEDEGIENDFMSTEQKISWSQASSKLSSSTPTTSSTSFNHSRQSFYIDVDYEPKKSQSKFKLTDSERTALIQFQNEESGGNNSNKVKNCKGKEDGVWEGEEYESSKDPFLSFQKRLTRAPEQILRYQFDGVPLWPSSIISRSAPPSLASTPIKTPTPCLPLLEESNPPPPSPFDIQIPLNDSEISIPFASATRTETVQSQNLSKEKKVSTPTKSPLKKNQRDFDEEQEQEEEEEEEEEVSLEEQERVVDIPTCQNCGSTRVCELQLMPTLPSLLSLKYVFPQLTSLSNPFSPKTSTTSTIQQLSSEGFHFGTVVLYTCSQSCEEKIGKKNSETQDKNYLEEFVFLHEPI